MMHPKKAESSVTLPYYFSVKNMAVERSRKARFV